MFLTEPVHLLFNSPRSLMRFIGEKITLIAHQFSNLVPEIATIVEHLPSSLLVLVIRLY